MSTLFEVFPRLQDQGFASTSPPDDDYNCIAWAAGDPSRWWWPAPVLVAPWYWPEGLPLGDESIENFANAFRLLGYEICEDGRLEDGVEKIVLYGQAGLCLHASRQLADGRWASKLGRFIDIEHLFADSLSGPKYGQVVVYMSRTRRSPS